MFQPLTSRAAYAKLLAWKAAGLYICTMCLIVKELLMLLKILREIMSIDR